MDRESRHDPEPPAPPRGEAGLDPNRPRPAASAHVRWDQTPFRDVALIGKGGMGEVLRAADTRTGRLVALKFVTSADPQKRARLEREGLLGAKLEHPNVIRVHELYALPGGQQQLLVTEFVPGARHLDEVWRELELRPRVDLLRAAASGVAAAHAQGITHRDLKPDNILVSGEGRVRVADFGIAFGAGLDRLTQPGAIVGTPSFMAPEQLTAQPPTPPTDVWALGVLLYLALTDSLPFQAQSLIALAGEIAEGLGPEHHAALRESPPALTQLVKVCLQPDPAARPMDAAAFVTTLDAWLANPRGAARSSLTLAMTLLLVVCLVAGVAAWIRAAPTPAAAARPSAPLSDPPQRAIDLDAGLRLLEAGRHAEGASQLEALTPAVTASELAPVRGRLVRAALARLAAKPGSREAGALLEPLVALAPLLPPAARGDAEAPLLESVLEQLLKTEALTADAHDLLALLAQTGAKVRDDTTALHLVDLFFQHVTFKALPPEDQRRWFRLLIRLDVPTVFLSGSQFGFALGTLGPSPDRPLWAEFVRLRSSPVTPESGARLEELAFDPELDLGPRQQAETLTRATNARGEDALPILERALARDPDCVSALARLTEVYAAQGDAVAASAAATRCAETMRRLSFPSFLATRNTHGRRLHELAEALTRVEAWPLARELVAEGAAYPSSTRSELLTAHPRLRAE